ncbi:MAG: hypothetical protein A2X12_10755 [Bacteroidetes bacterium GWE2_29_8]|nr:MAG: hypothetical protein A2X12_10755 [Bacteroidetes bacterium GWE2_29_8]OFY24828.1 MAG: hypothetical protein A2X02_03770 [Bacteroidetes bacterium GWF2_29_10]
MGKLFDQLLEDVRIKEGLKACINCGTCTAICPAASFYDYDPRYIINEVQSRDDERIENLLKGEKIWYCGECMSCKTRCPRDNTPGLIITVLRAISQDKGYFIESEKGRQQFAIKRTVGEWILKYGYCTYMEGAGTDLFPEQGPIWDWRQDNWREVIDQLGGNCDGDGPGILRKVPEESLNELRAIFEVTGAMKRFQTIEDYSRNAAKEDDIEFKDTGIDNKYFETVYKDVKKNHYLDTIQ